MAEDGSKVHENSFDRWKEHVRHGANKVIHFRHPSNPEALSIEGNGPHPTTISEQSPALVDRSNVDDFPYDSSREDEFTSELASVADEDDGIASPRSQSSMDTLHSSVSTISWSSNQKNIGGLALKEGRSQEVLGPYKRSGKERALGAVPAEYEDYVNDRKAPKSSAHDTTHSAGNSSFERSSSTSSDRSVPDSLYADLSSISDRDLQVPEGLVKAAEGYDNNVNDNEGRASPNQSSHVGEHVSNLKLH